MMAGIENTYATSSLEVPGGLAAQLLVDSVKNHKLEVATRLLEFGLDVVDGVMTGMERDTFTGQVVLTFRWEIRTKK
jgi:hypothetical protein